MGKHIICSGCSFTRQEKRIGLDGDSTNFYMDDPSMWRWPHWIQKLYPKKIVYNIGNPTNGNNLIAVSTIHKVTELLNRGIKPKDIQVFIQWSEMTRESFYVSQDTLNFFGEKEIDLNQEKDYNASAHTNFFASKNKNLNTYGHYILCAGNNSGNHLASKFRRLVVQNISKLQNVERAAIKHYESILLIQNFLKQKKIDYLMFNYPRNFCYDNNNEKYNLTNNYSKKIPKNIFDFKYDNPYIDYFVENVDWDKIWFYKDKTTNIGGLIDFAIMNYDFDRDGYLFMEHTVDECKSAKDVAKFHLKKGSHNVGHISSQMNKVFVEKILRKYLEN
tara:strand:+ start:547 stop:1542 length:996 start_codon:yes stop_codon:yes gene_type:complete